MPPTLGSSLGVSLRESLILVLDPLSDILRVLRPSGSLTTHFEAAGAWSLRFGGYQHVKFGIVRRGRCFVGARELVAGDCYVLSSGEPYVLSSDPALVPEDGEARYRRAARDGVLRIGADPDLVLDGGTLTFEPGVVDVLLDVLPPVLVVADLGTRAIVEQLAAEAAQPGAELVREHLTQVLFVRMLRTVERPGWLGALTDPAIGQALRRIHADPAGRWSVAALAADVHLSRSAFATRFTRLVGVSPAAYAKRWRMHRAAVDLREPGATAGVVGRRYGYASHSAFSHAYKDVMGVPPSRAGA
jgi:AraC-like DNA-binding protein